MSLQPTTYVPNPSVPFVSFIVNGANKDFADESRPQHLMEFQITMALDVMGQWTIKLFDPEYQVIEQTLLDHYKEGVTIQFGWQGSSLRSASFLGSITDYQPNFKVGGVELTISGFTQEFAKASTVKSRAYPDAGNNIGKPGMLISDIVQAICTANGWEVEHIEKTQPNPSYSATEDTSHLEQPFIQKGTDWEFITQVLAPRARSDSHPEQGAYYTFCNPYDKKLTFAPTRVKTLDPVAEFTFIQDKLNEITSFQPNFKGLWLTLGGGKTYGSIIEEQSKQVGTVEASRKNDKTPSPAGQQDVLPPTPTQEELDEEHSCSADSGIMYSPSVEALKNRNTAIWNAAIEKAYAEIQMSIIGRPDNDTIKFLPGQNVKVNVITPPPDRAVNYLSGIFMIVGVTHLITPHGFTTQLTLNKNSGGSGDQQVTEAQANAVTAAVLTVPLL